MTSQISGPPAGHRPGRRDTARRLLGPIGGALGGVAGVAVVATVDPNEPGHYPTCPFLAVTGRYCPGCGSLRAVHALAHGDVGEALARNPLLVASVPLVLVLWGLWVRRTVTGKQRTWAAPAWWIWGLLVLVLAYWVARNLPGATWLAP